MAVSRTSGQTATVSPRRCGRHQPPLNFPLEPDGESGIVFTTSVGGAGSGVSNGGFASSHPGGANFAMGDGSVSFMSEDIDLDTYRALSTRDGGEVVGEL